MAEPNEDFSKIPSWPHFHPDIVRVVMNKGRWLVFLVGSVRRGLSGGIWQVTLQHLKELFPPTLISHQPSSARVPGAGGGGANVCVFLNPGVHSPANFKLDQPARRGSLGADWGVRGGKGPASVGCLWDERGSAGCSQRALRWSRGPVGWVRVL